MVLLTMTPAMVRALKTVQAEAAAAAPPSADDAPAPSTVAAAADDDGPDLRDPDVAKPITHTQVLRLWAALKARPSLMDDGATPSLEALLTGAAVYVPPPAPKPEPSGEYKALMARLRREAEARAYERMVSPPNPYETGSFAQVNRPVYAADTGDDGVTMSDVNRQVMLIFNFVLTMGGVAYALWVLARWWPTPSRLFLAMGGSIAVGFAEYGLYAGYVWHLTDAAKKEKAAAAKEVRAVVKTWVVGPGGDGAEAEAEGEKDEKDEQREQGEQGKQVRGGAVAVAKQVVREDGSQETRIPDGVGATGISLAQARRRKKETRAL